MNSLMYYNIFMRLLIVFNHPAPYKVRFFNELAKSVDLTVIFERTSASDRNAQFYDEKKYLFKSVFIDGLKIGHENICTTKVAKYINKNHDAFDLIIMNGYSQFAELFAIRLMKKKHIKYALYINGGIIKQNESTFKKRFKRKYISGADLYFSPDSNSNDYLIHYGASKDKIKNYSYSTIYEKDVLEAPLSKENKIKLREKLGIECRECFISTGQFIERKNFLGLIKIWKNQPHDHLLILVGGGSQQELYEHYIFNNKIDNVLLFPFMKQKELFEYFRASDVFIFLSKEDIYGHVINEAMSQGLKIISSESVNSARKLIVDGVNGFLVDFDNEDLIKQRIIDIRTKDFGALSLESARKNTIEIMAKEHIEILKEYLEK